jgi:hypothetical protein
MSITKNIISIICAPPIIVLSNDACPGQSTSVNCNHYYFTFTYKNSGILLWKAENPKSRVIPLSWDCGCLSREAVDVI